MQNIYLHHVIVYIEGFGHCLVLSLEGKDVPPERTVPQHFLLSGVN